jgi:hypothetical protein
MGWYIDGQAARPRPSGDVFPAPIGNGPQGSPTGWLASGRGDSRRAGVAGIAVPGATDPTDLAFAIPMHSVNLRCWFRSGDHRYVRPIFAGWEGDA